MKALTLIQPWAWCVAHAGKDIENRTWLPHEGSVGSYIAIHAGKKLDALTLDEIVKNKSIAVLGMNEARGVSIKSAIVAVVRVVGVVRPFGPWDRAPFDVVARHNASWRAPMSAAWFEGPFGWCLDNVMPIEPLTCSGRQGLWDVPADLMPELRRRWLAASRERCPIRPFARVSALPR
mgnify:CR=1 FL=1